MGPRRSRLQRLDDILRIEPSSASEKIRELNQTRDKDLAAVLTADQTAAFAKLKGKEFDVAQLRRGPGGPGGGQGGGRGGNRPQRPAQ